MPSTKVSNSNTQGVIAPSTVSQPSKAAATNIQPWAKSRSRRLSTRSASAPAGIISKKTGSPESVWTSPTIRALGASDVISHAAATFCIQVPMFEANAATNRPKKAV